MTEAEVRLQRRLGPLYLTAFLASVALWVPIEKLFMTDIGFDNGSVAVMAAAYAAVVPLLEVPSGILADRWSRRGVLLLAQLAMIVSVLVGGLSPNVGMYILAALFLGVFFACYSGTFESMAYDTVVEETGNSEAFERTIGRIRFVESAGLVFGALAGGLLAEVIPLRATYFLTAPFVAAGSIAVLRFREPQLHRAEEEQPLRAQVVATYRTLLERGAIRPLILLLVLGAVLMQAILEFGPLWLVALDSPAGLYGPHWAGLMAALGLGGLLGAHLVLTHPLPPAGVAATVVGCCALLLSSHVVGLVIVGQVLLVAALVALSIPLTARLHDAVPSTIRAGVASGVGTLTWLTFLPFAFVFGAVSDREAGVYDGSWTVAALGALVIGLLGWAVYTFMRTPAAVPLEPAFAADQFRPDDEPEWPGHWVDPPPAWAPPGELIEGAALLAEARDAITELPSPQHDVIVARDVAGRSPSETSEELHLSEADERALLNQARGSVRRRLDKAVREGDE